MDSMFAALFAFVLGVSAPLIVTWYQEKRRQQRVTALINGWFHYQQDRRAMDYELLIRFIGMDLRDPQLLFQAALLHTLRQMHHTTTSKPKVSAFLLEDLDEIREEVERFLRSQRRWRRVSYAIKKELLD